MQIRTGPLYRTKDEADRAAARLNASDPVPSWRVIVSRRAPGQWTIVSER
jgi:hypothetical protein